MGIFFLQAAIAEFVHRIRLNHVLAKAAMMIVAVSTFHFSFPDRMVGLLIFLRPDGPMADIAEVRLSGFQIFPGTRMNGMAVIA